MFLDLVKMGYIMNNNMLNEKMIISNPVYYARSTVLFKMGDRGMFSSRGMIIKGRVQKVVEVGLRTGFNVYMVDDVVEMTEPVLEMTCKERNVENRKKKSK